MVIMILVGFEFLILDKLSRYIYKQQNLQDHGGDPCAIIGYVSTLIKCIYWFIRWISEMFQDLTVNVLSLNQ